MRTTGSLSIVKHLNAPERSPFFSKIAGQQPEMDFLADALHMVVSDVKLDELVFYMEGYRSRLVTHEKADIHLTNLIFRTIWAIAHSSWDPLRCTEYGRAVIPKVSSVTRAEWIDRCNKLEIDRTQSSAEWGTMLDEIRQAAGKASG